MVSGQKQKGIVRVKKQMTNLFATMMEYYYLHLNKYFSVPTAVNQHGDKKIGDPCNRTSDCGFEGANCAGVKKSTCQCLPDLTASNHVDKCGKCTYPAPSMWERAATGFKCETLKLCQLYG
jgi:hypothetical protein